MSTIHKADPPSALGAPATFAPPVSSAPIEPPPTRPVRDSLRGIAPSKTRHAWSGGTALASLLVGGGAYAMDPAQGLDIASPLVFGPIATLGVQLIKSLIDTWRDYGADKLDAERARAEAALQREAVAQAQIKELQAEIARRDKRDDEAREAELDRLRAMIEKMQTLPQA